VYSFDLLRLFPHFRSIHYKYLVLWVFPEQLDQIGVFLRTSRLVFCLLNEDQQDALFFPNLFEKCILLHFSNRLTIHYQEAVTLYAACGTYHAENIKVM
jgi:hypothetical protein